VTVTSVRPKVRASETNRAAATIVLRENGVPRNTTADSTHSAVTHHDAPAKNAWSQRIRNRISFDISLLLLTLNFAGENRLRAAAGGDMCVRKGRF
jgi:hypothetical protein